MNFPVGGGARDGGQHFPVFCASVCHRALPGWADRGDRDEPEGGRAPGRRHDTTAGAGGQRAAEERKRPRRARPIRWLHTLYQGWWGSNEAQFDVILTYSKHHGRPRQSWILSAAEFLFLTFPDVPHPQQRSTCQRLVCGVGELWPGNRDHLQGAGSSGGGAPGRAEDYGRNRSAKCKTQGFASKDNKQWRHEEW